MHTERGHSSCQYLPLAPLRLSKHACIAQGMHPCWPTSPLLHISDKAVQVKQPASGAAIGDKHSLYSWVLKAWTCDLPVQQLVGVSQLLHVYVTTNTAGCAGSVEVAEFLRGCSDLYDVESETGFLKSLGASVATAKHNME